jgi:integral membrane protein
MSEQVRPEQQVRPVADVAAARKALGFFKVMAILVGIGLLVLCLGMVLKFGYDKPGLSEFWDQKHGFLYMIYVFSTANLGFKMRWSLGRMVGVMLAGVVPFLSFWAERKVGGQVEGELVAQDAGSLAP